MPSLPESGKLVSAHGDIVVWDTYRLAEIRKAKNVFQEMLMDGWTAFEVSGEIRRPLLSFDASAVEILMIAPPPKVVKEKKKRPYYFKWLSGFRRINRAGSRRRKSQKRKALEFYRFLKIYIPTNSGNYKRPAVITAVQMEPKAAVEPQNTEELIALFNSGVRSDSNP